MLAILLAHAVAAAVAPLLVYRWGRLAFYPLALVPALSLIWVGVNWPLNQPGDVRTVHLRWVPELSMNVDLRFDALSAIMAVLVLAIGALVLFYCADYFHHHDGHAEQRLPSFAAQLVAFSGAMFGLVVSDNLLLLYLFWELTTVLSFALVAHYAERASSRRAAMQALLVTTAGGLAMLVGIIVLGHTARTYLLSQLVAAPTVRHFGSVGLALVLVGARQQVGVGAPAFLAARRNGRAHARQRVPARRRDGQGRRLSGGPADTRLRRCPALAADRRHPRPRHMLLAGWRAVREYDLKLILAFGTVSQLGFITLLVGAGGGDLMLAGLAMLCAHATVQGGAVHGCRHHRPRHRHPRHPQARVARSANAGRCSSLRSACGGQHGRAAPVPRLRRQGGRLRDDRAQRRHSAPRRRSYSARSCSVPSSRPSTAFASCGVRSPARGGPGPAPLVSHMHKPSPSFLAAPAILAAAGLVFGPHGRAGLDDVLSTTPTRCPAQQLPPRTLARRRPGTALSVLVLAAGIVAFLAAGPVAPRSNWLAAAGQCRPHLRRGSARRSICCRCGSPHHPAWFDPRDPVGDPVHAGAAAGLCLALGARDRPHFAVVGLAAATRRRPARSSPPPSVRR